MRMYKINAAMALMNAIFSLENSPARPRTRQLGTSYKGNKITTPNSNGVYPSNVQDNSTDKVHALHKRSRKNEKRWADYRKCLVNNTLISFEDFRLLTCL